MLENLKEKNPEITFHTTADKKFKKYGRVLNYNTTQLIDQLSQSSNLNKIKAMPKASYRPNIPSLHHYDFIDLIRQDIFGELDIQVGIVEGRNNFATGTEFHQGSEVNIAITDCILVLGSKYDMINEEIDISQMVIFYVKKGEALEIYSSTLHYTPIEVDSNGFEVIVILIKGTNTDIDCKNNSLLCKKNKWYVAHKTQTDKIKRGFKAGLTGPLLEIKYTE